MCYLCDQKVVAAGTMNCFATNVKTGEVSKRSYALFTSRTAQLELKGAPHTREVRRMHTQTHLVFTPVILGIVSRRQGGAEARHFAVTKCGLRPTYRSNFPIDRFLQSMTDSSAPQSSGRRPTGFNLSFFRVSCGRGPTKKFFRPRCGLRDSVRHSYSTPWSSFVIDGFSL